MVQKLYDENGSQVVGFSDREIKNIFGTLNSKKRKQHHRLYLDKIDRTKLHSLVDSVFKDDRLYLQYIRLVSPHYQKTMRGLIGMNFIKASLLYFGYPHQQHNSYESMLMLQVLFMRKTIFVKLQGLKHNKYFDEPIVKCGVPKKKLIQMGKRISNSLESEVCNILPAFHKAIKIDKELK